jgi:hypothetical protein
MDQLRFEEGLGHYSVSVAPDSVWISRGMGTHYFQIQLQVGIPQVGAAAGRLLCLETTLYTPQATALACRSRQRTCPCCSTPRARSGCPPCST